MMRPIQSHIAPNLDRYEQAPFTVEREKFERTFALRAFRTQLRRLAQSERQSHTDPRLAHAAVPVPQSG
jgi:hypothetical protein